MWQCAKVRIFAPEFTDIQRSCNLLEGVGVVPSFSLGNPFNRFKAVVIVVTLAGMVVATSWFSWSAWRAAKLWNEAVEAADREDWAETGAALEQRMWYRPDDRAALHLQVQAAIGRGEPLAAAALLGRVPPSAPEAVEARLTQGRLLMDQYRPREAEAVFRDCLKIDPRADAARLALIAILAFQRRGLDYDNEAWTLYEKGAEPIKALRLLAQAAPTIPPDTFTKTADMGDVLERCLETDPDDLHTRLALARFERGRGRIEIALKLLEPCLAVSPPDPEARLEWAACLLDEGELDQVRSLFENPDASIRTHASFWLLKSEWARRRGSDEQAIMSLSKAIRLNPRSTDANYRLGLALGGVGPEATRCLEVAQKARELKDFVAQISDRSRDRVQLMQAGRLCRDLGRSREARAWFMLALRLDRHDAEARAAIAQLDSESTTKGDPPAAETSR